MVLLIAQWGVYYIPLDFRLVKPKIGKGYRSENTLVRDMLEALVLPPWCEKIIVVVDVAYALRKNLVDMSFSGEIDVLILTVSFLLSCYPIVDVGG